MADKTKKNEMRFVEWKKKQNVMKRIREMNIKYIRDGPDLRNGQIITINYSKPQHVPILFVCILFFSGCLHRTLYADNIV